MNNRNHSDHVSDQITTRPRMIVTGASGFIGRHFLDTVKENYRIIAIGRRSQTECGAPRHGNITWNQIDIGDMPHMVALFESIRDTGGADILVHLAAHYDFTGEDHPEYWRTNVDGLRNTLELSRRLGLRKFIFASSVAACRYPPPGGALNEDSPADGEHIYAVTKGIGEKMLQEYAAWFPSCIVRFAALFSDWCEYAPLFMFLDTWLSNRWNARMLGGRGQSAIPYMHVRDSASMLRTLLDREADIAPGEVLIASPDGAVSHEELFRAATGYYFGQPRHPIHMPRPLCRPGMWFRDLAGRMLGQRPFEQPWMADYIDLSLTVDARRTRARLGWSPRERLDVIRRLPFLIENYKTNPFEWYHRNREALKLPNIRPNLKIYRLLEHHEEDLRDRFHALLSSPEGQTHLSHYQQVDREEHSWHHRLFIRNLMNAIRTREKGVFMAYCRDLAERRFAQGYELDELLYVISSLNRICVDLLRHDPAAADLEQAIHDHVTVTIQFGLDQVSETYELLTAGRSSDASASRIADQLWSSRERHRQS